MLCSTTTTHRASRSLLNTSRWMKMIATPHLVSLPISIKWRISRTKTCSKINRKIRYNPIQRTACSFAPRTMKNRVCVTFRSYSPRRSSIRKWWQTLTRYLSQGGALSSHRFRTTIVTAAIRWLGNLQSLHPEPYRPCQLTQGRGAIVGWCAAKHPLWSRSAQGQLPITVINALQEP